MNTQIALQLLLRLLPSIILFVTAFFVVKDENVKKRWADLLYRAGSIKSAQREDPKIREGVRLPFLVLGGLFLLWPIFYYFRDSYAQLPVTPVALPTPVAQATPTPASSATAAPGVAPPSLPSRPGLPNQSGAPSQPGLPSPGPTAGGGAPPRVLR